MGERNIFSKIARLVETIVDPRGVAQRAQDRYNTRIAYENGLMALEASYNHWCNGGHPQPKRSMSLAPELAMGHDLAKPGEDQSVYSIVADGLYAGPYLIDRQFCYPAFIIAANGHAARKVAGMLIRRQIPNLYHNLSLAIVQLHECYPSYTDKKYRVFSVMSFDQGETLSITEVMS